ncbi:MAG: ECF transporter S component [Clostridiales bacterium]|nr:ECF transporter S component [Clostridiales bacterium]
MKRTEITENSPSDLAEKAEKAKNPKRSRRNSIVWLTVTAMLMAMNIIMSMSILSIPVPGGHVYLNDAIVTIAAVLLDPLGAFLVGGVGAFLGDLFFYPAPMFVSLVTHGLQAIVISLCAHKMFKSKKAVGAVIGVIFGIIINVAGYSIGREFIYGTAGSALVKLPYQILQATVGSALGLVLCYPCRLTKLYAKMIKI